MQQTLSTVLVISQCAKITEIKINKTLSNDKQL